MPRQVAEQAHLSEYDNKSGFAIAWTRSSETFKLSLLTLNYISENHKLKIYQSSVASSSISLRLTAFVEVSSNTSAQDQVVELSDVHLSVIYVLIIGGGDFDLSSSSHLNYIWAQWPLAKIFKEDHTQLIVLSTYCLLISYQLQSGQKSVCNLWVSMVI